MAHSLPQTKGLKLLSEMFSPFQCSLFTETSQYHTLQSPLDGFDGSLQCGGLVCLLAQPSTALRVT